MTEDKTSERLTPKQQQALDDAELLADYASLSHSHLEALGEEAEDQVAAGADQATLQELRSNAWKWYHWTFLLLLVVVIIIFGAFALSGNDSTETAASTPSQTQGPIPIAGNTWVFFADKSESMGLYTIEFASDGSLVALGDPHIYSGSWVEEGDSVEIILLHRQTLEAGTFSAVHENEEIFRMTRDGNAMRGEWDVEDMYYSEEGLVIEGRRINQPNVFARPR